MFLDDFQEALLDSLTAQEVQRAYIESDQAAIMQLIKQYGRGAHSQNLAQIFFELPLRHGEIQLHRRRRHNLRRRLRCELTQYHYSDELWQEFWQRSADLASLVGYGLSHDQRQGILAEAAVFLAAHQAGIDLRSGSVIEDIRWAVDWWHRNRLVIQVKSNRHGELAYYHEQPPHVIPLQCQPTAVKRGVTEFRRRLKQLKTYYARSIKGVLIVAPVSEFDEYTAQPSAALTQCIKELFAS